MKEKKKWKLIKIFKMNNQSRIFVVILLICQIRRQNLKQRREEEIKMMKRIKKKKKMNNKKMRMYENNPQTSYPQSQSQTENKEKEKEEVNEKNIWKKSRKIQMEFFCKTTPTLVITPVNGRLYKSQTSVIKLFGKGGKFVSSKLKAHTFSSTLGTVYVHFNEKTTTEEELHQIAEKFNQDRLEEVKKEEESIQSDEKEDKKKKQPRIMKCSVYRSTYAAEQKEKRSKQVLDPEENRFVLLKNVPLFDTEAEILEVLQNLGLGVEKLERFARLPIVKVLFSTSEDVRKVLNEGKIQIGYQMVSFEPFDKFRRRPRSHFHQCRNCFGLNHLAKDCTRAKRCRYCGYKNHESKDCRYKRNQEKQKCVLCSGKHYSDSILCPVIQKVRKQIKVNLSRKEEKVILKRTEKETKKVEIKSKYSEKAVEKRKEPLSKSPQFESAMAPNPEPNMNMHSNQNEPSRTQNPRKRNKKNNNNNRNNNRNNNNRYNNNQKDEISELRKEISALREIVSDLTSMFKKFSQVPLYQQDPSDQVDQDLTDLEPVE